MDLLQDLLHEFVPGIRVFIWSLRSKVCVLKSGGPDREPPGASEEPFFRAFSTQDKNEVTFFFRIGFGVTFCDIFQIILGNSGGSKFGAAPFWSCNVLRTLRDTAAPLGC